MTEKKNQVQVPLAPEEETDNMPYMKTPWNGGGEISATTTPVAPAPSPGTGTSDLYNIVGDSYLMSPEEEQRRMNRMRTASAIGNLGNVMSAFANLYYTGKGAPSQKVPDAVIPPYMQFVDRVNQARKNAASMQLAREKMQTDNEYKDAMLGYKYNQLERQMALDQIKIENAKKTGDLTDLKILREQVKYDLDKETSPLEIAYKKKRLDNIDAAIASKYVSMEVQQRNADRADAKEAREAGGKSVEKIDQFGNKTTVNTSYNRGGGSDQKKKEKTKTQL